MNKKINNNMGNNNIIEQEFTAFNYHKKAFNLLNSLFARETKNKCKKFGRIKGDNDFCEKCGRIKGDNDFLSFNTGLCDECFQENIYKNLRIRRG